MKRGWCPSLYAPMASGDGLLVRVKPPGARLTPGQALAFAKSKPKSEAWKMLYRHLSNWLTGNAIAQNVACPAPLRVDAMTIDAIVAITTQPAEAYLAATAEALALVLWIKRLAEASIVDTPPPEQAPEISPTV